MKQDKLNPKYGDDIFVFGSNLGGHHGGGAALCALKHHGAEKLVGKGLTGASYALPTKDENIQTLPLDVIQDHVEDFLDFAETHPELRFYVTRVGCGLAGYTDAEIAPLFYYAPDNCVLPKGWRE